MLLSVMLAQTVQPHSVQKMDMMVSFLVTVYELYGANRPLSRKSVEPGNGSILLSVLCTAPYALARRERRTNKKQQEAL